MEEQFADKANEKMIQAAVAHDNLLAVQKMFSILSDQPSRVLVQGYERAWFKVNRRKRLLEKCKQN